MNKERKCLYCGSVIPADKRWDAKFCNNTCKAKHWEENKIPVKTGDPAMNQPSQSLQAPQTARPLDGSNAMGNLPVKPQPQTAPGELRGLTQTPLTGPPALQTDVSNVKQTAVLPPSAPKEEWIEKQVETPAYQEITGLLRKMNSEAERLRSILSACDKQIYEIRNQSGAPLQKTGMALGGLIAYHKTEKNLWATLGGAVLGFGTGKLIDYLFIEDMRKKEIEKSVARIQQKKAEVQKLLEEQNKQIERGKKCLSGVTRYETKKVKRVDFISLLMLNPFKKINELSAEKTETQEKKQAQTPAQMDGNPVEEPEHVNAADKAEETDVSASSKLVTSSQLRRRIYKGIPFQGKWKDFFGEPSPHFHLAVHGKPGEGKSTFCIQFADYLAKTFGKVVYLSGEERLEKTLYDKVIQNKIDNPHFIFADIGSYEEIEKEIENIYNFIFIDSLDTLKIDAGRLRLLKERYSKSAFITISQSTKDGKMRGSQEIIHDSDITVKVENGVARTTKNRCKAGPSELKIFTSPEK